MKIYQRGSDRRSQLFLPRWLGRKNGTQMEFAPILTSTREKRLVCSIKCVGLHPEGRRSLSPCGSSQSRPIPTTHHHRSQNNFLLNQAPRAVVTEKDSPTHGSRDCLAGSGTAYRHLTGGNTTMCVDGKGDWTEKHRDVARKIFLEGGWTQKRLFDIGGQTTVSVKLVRWRKVSGSLPKMRGKSENIEERMEIAKRYSRTPTQWNPVE